MICNRRRLFHLRKSPFRLFPTQGVHLFAVFCFPRGAAARARRAGQPFPRLSPILLRSLPSLRASRRRLIFYLCANFFSILNRLTCFALKFPLEFPYRFHQPNLRSTPCRKIFYSTRFFLLRQIPFSLILFLVPLRDHLKIF